MKEAAAEPTVSLTPEQLKEIMVALVQELKRPSKEEQAKLDEEKDRLAQRRAAMIEEGKRQDLAVARTQASCNHTKPNGESLVHKGQIYSDGLMRPMCLRCMKQFAPMRAPQELVAGTGF